LLEEAIRKLKHCYEQSKRKVEPKCELKGSEKVKGKWPQKWGRPQDAGKKGNVFLHNLKISRIEVIAEDHCSVGYVENIITRNIFHCTRVAGLISIVLRKRRLLGMWAIEFLGFMQL